MYKKIKFSTILTLLILGVVLLALCTYVVVGYVKNRQLIIESKIEAEKYLKYKYPGVGFDVGNISLLFPNGWTSARVTATIDDEKIFFSVMPNSRSLKDGFNDDFVSCKLGNDAKKELIPFLKSQFTWLNDNNIVQIEVHGENTRNNYTLESIYHRTTDMPLFMNVTWQGDIISEDDFKLQVKKFIDILLTNNFFTHSITLRYEWGADKNFGSYVCVLGEDEVNSLICKISEMVIFKYGKAKQNDN